MRANRLPSPRPWTLAAAAAALALAACGGSEEAGQPAPVAKAGTPAPAAPSGAPATPVSAPATPAAAPDAHDHEHEAPATLTVTTPPGSTEPPVYEQPVERPLQATFTGRGTDEVRPTIPDLPANDPVLGKPLVINGKVVPFEEVRAQVCLGTLGVPEIELQKLRVFMDEEIKRKLGEGVAKEAVEYSEGEMEAYLKELEAEIKEQYPEGEVGMDDVLWGLGGADPRERLRAMQLFGKLYLPENPELFPPITLESIRAMQGGEEIVQHYHESWEEAQKDPSAPKKKKNVAERTFDDAILQGIVAHLNETARIERRPAPGVLYRVNGSDITVDSVWKAIQTRVSMYDVRAAKQWIVNLTLLPAALGKNGAWLNDEAAAAAYEVHSGPYKDSIFSRERIAVLIKHFPSVEAYQDYRRIYESFKVWKKDEMTQEALDKQAAFRTKKIVGNVAVDVDVLLCSSYDYKTQRWKEDGWLGAEKRMQDVVRLLMEEDRSWDELMERYSDFYQPPVPVADRGQVDPNAPKKGRFRAYQRNNLLNELGESEYGLFLSGDSITDFIFFEQEVGTLADPMRGPTGWYMPRLLRRTKAPERVSMKPAEYAQLVEEDYLMWNLNQYAQQLVRESQVYGLDDPDPASTSQPR